jgi:acetyl-CoA acetyltransferase
MINSLKNRDIAIIAYAETRIERRSGRSTYDIAAEATAKVLDYAGLTTADIDGLATLLPGSEATNNFWSNYLGDHLGLTTTWTQTSDLGGASAVANVARAASAIQSGYCEMVLSVAADASTTRRVDDQRSYRSEFRNPVGIQGPPGAFGLLMRRYMYQYELQFEALGKLAVAQRNGAIVNENAVEGLRKSLTVEDYLNARMVSTPLRLLDSVMPCDGGNAILITTTDRARKMGVKKMAHPVSYAEIVNFNIREQLPDVTETGFSVAGPRALEKAGMTTDDIDMFHPYDDFLIAEMLQLEQIGFCGRGEGSDFLLATDLSPTGRLPINTGGGQISAGQPGLAGGQLNLVEAVRQLFGEATGRQVPNPRTAMVTGIGVIPYVRNWGNSNVLILERGS